jgi:hypothetical protein
MAKRSLVYIFLLIIFACPALSDTYPKVDVTGFKKWEYRGAHVSPASNYFAGLTYLGGFSPTATGTPWQERLQLKITAQLSEKLRVSYDIEQQPEAPEHYNVVLNYDNKHELIFGDFTATFSGNEFASSTKVLNGMMFTSRDDGYELIAVPATKLKSAVQGISSQRGNNTKGPYFLGNGSIIEGSEQIELNTIPLEKDKDYVIDYLEGKITFTQILLETDEFKYSYEYTNISDLFFPALSRKDFVGFQSRFKFDPNTWGKPVIPPQEITQNNYEVFPSPPDKKEEVREAEESGRYRLERYPVVRFSEVLTFRGATLTKDVDYSIDYQKGKITLLSTKLPKKDDPLQVSYNYKKTELVQEILPGKDSRGPYSFFNHNIIPRSEQIFINDRPLAPELDYHIDYENGQIIFNYIIPSTSVIRADYRYVELTAIPAVPAPRFKQDLSVGMTYLRESARSGAQTATASITETFSGVEDTLYLSRLPLIPTSEGGTLFISVDGRTLTPEVDYTVPTVEADPVSGYAKVIPDTRLAYINDRNDLTDGYYTGTIKLLTTIEATQEVSVGYTYYKSIVGRYAGIGNGGRGPYYIQGYRNIIPGSERVEVWKTSSTDIIIYTRNSSFEPDAGDTGYSINYYRGNPYITFNNELAPNQNFSVYFQYVPTVSRIGQDIKQEITGFDAEYSFGEFLQVVGNFATSKTDNVVVAKSTVETVTFTPPTQTIRVTQYNTPAVIDGSEKVYINNYLRNRDIDYGIDYDTGTITFYYTTLTTGDAVVVEFEYPDPGGIPRVGETVDMAYKYGAKSSMGPVSLSYNEKAIGFDFTPLGGTALGVGSTYRDFSAAYAPGFHGLSTGYDYKETVDPISGSRESFTRTYDRNYSLGVNPFGWAGMSAGFHHQETKGDPLNTSGSLSANSEVKEYTGSLSPPGIKLWHLSHSHSYNGKLTDSQNFLDNSFSRNKYFHTNHALGFTKWIRGGFDYAFSEPYSLTGYQTTSESIVSKSTTQDFAYDLSLDLTYAPLHKWTAYAKFIDHQQENKIPTREVSRTLNTTYHTELVPHEILELSYDQNREETPTVVVAGKNPRSEKAATNVVLKPVSNFSTGWAHTNDSTIHETGRESSGYSDNYTANWTVVSLDTFTFGTGVTKYNRSETVPSGSFEAVHADTDTFTYSYGITWDPQPNLTITPNFSQQDYRYVSDIQSPLEARAQTTSLGITFRPYEDLDTTFDYSLKTTSTPTVSPRHKATANLGLSHRIYDWGSVTLSEEHEHNQGEVQAGGSFPDLDYIRVTRALGISFTIPQENPLISAIVFNLNYKTVGYDNRLPGGDKDDLHAAMVTFDGALNF